MTTTIVTTDTPSAGGFIYVIKFSNGVVKVGSSRAPDSRLRQHRSDAKAFDLALVDTWVSERHTGYLDSEQTLIWYAGSRAGRRLSREYFHGVDVDDVRRTASAIARSNGTLAVTIHIHDEQLFSLREIRTIYPHLDIRAIHQDCIYGRTPAVVTAGQYHLTRKVIDDLLSRAEGDVVTRSVRHRMQRRAA